MDLFPSDWPDVQYVFNTAGQPDATPGGFLALNIAVLKATSLGSVTINSSNTAVNPLVDIRYLDTASDRDMAVQAIKRARDFVKATGILLGEVSPGEQVQTDEQIWNFLKGATFPSHHAVGSCRMGSRKDSVAVVDTQGCVLGGMERLRIIDSSIMPVLPPGQPMSTVYAIAEKLSDAIVYGRACWL